MAYDDIGTWDWNELRQVVWCDEDRLGSKFPIELAPDLVLSPHLYGWSQPRGFEERAGRTHHENFYTLTDPPSFVLYVARGDEPLRFLREDLAPILPASCRLVVVDGERARFSVAPAPGMPLADARPLAELPRLLNGWLGEDVVLDGTFDRLALPWQFPLLAPAMVELREDIARTIERTPLRLWELFFEEVKRPLPLTILHEEKDEETDALEGRIGAAFGEGVREVWIVRRRGDPLVEVRLPNGASRTVRAGEELDIPGVLRHPVPAAALCTDVKEEILWRKALKGISKRGGPEA